MRRLTKIGQVFYGIGLIAVGTHQLIFEKFRAELLPPFPSWAQHIFFRLIVGIALVFSGAVISGLLKTKFASAKKVCLYVGFSFLVLIITCQLPYILFISSDKLSSLVVWFGTGEALAFGGGAFVMAGSFQAQATNNFESLLEKIIPAGKIFFSLLMILFGSTHFVFTTFVSTMVPKFVGAPLFWTYFFGVALVVAGIAIIFKLWIKPAALLLALSLFLFFLFFHVPDAIANPSVGSGNEITRAFVALLFCGIALVIATTSGQSNGELDRR
ncbi:MAG: hypothetical protein JSS79_04510 [Bacteroidetes bacterium]|nr:hypothetical protein [Bacteroidota bacterium]